MRLIDYIEKLIEQDIKVIPIKSFGKSYREAKEPLIPSGFKHTNYKSKDYIETACRLTRRTYYLVKNKKIAAFGLLGAINEFIILDFDRDKFPCSKYEHLFKALSKELFVERTPRGGFHAVVKAKSDSDLHLRFYSKLGEIDNKTFGYIISHPSRLFWSGKVAKYLKLEDSPDVWDTSYLDEVQAYLDLLEIEIYRGVKLGGVRANKSLPVYDFGIDELDNKQLIALLYLIAREIGCKGLAELYRAWFEKGIIPLKNYVYANNRGIHFTFEVTTLGILKTIGLSYERAVNFVREVKYVDGIKETSPENTSLRNVYAYDERNLVVRGLCPFCKNPCIFTPLSKLLMNIQRLDIKLLRRVLVELH